MDMSFILLHMLDHSVLTLSWVFPKFHSWGGGTQTRTSPKAQETGLCRSWSSATVQGRACGQGVTFRLCRIKGCFALEHLLAIIHAFLW